MKRTLVLALIAALSVGACSKKEEPSAGKAGQVASSKLQNAGRIVQVMQAGTYTYVEAMVDSGEKIWMAGAHIDAKPGDPIQWGNSSMMANYQSKALNRTFDRVLFVEAWSNGTGGPATPAAHGTPPALPQTGLPGGHPTMAGGVPGGHPPMGAAGGGGAPVGGGNSGIAKTVANAGGYSYIEVQQGGGSVWVAVPEAQVKAGDKVSWEGGSVMQNFNARSLNRTFDQIVFAGGVNVIK